MKSEKVTISKDDFNKLLNEKYMKSGMFIPGTSLEAFMFEVKIHYYDISTRKSVPPATEQGILEYASNCAADLRRNYLIAEEL
jgi:hypothetical protein